MPKYKATIMVKAVEYHEIEFEAADDRQAEEMCAWPEDNFNIPERDSACEEVFISAEFEKTDA